MDYLSLLIYPYYSLVFLYLPVGGVAAVKAVGAVAVLEFHGLVADGAAGRNRAGQEDAAADGRGLADGDIAEDSGVGVNDDFILQRGVAFVLAVDLALVIVRKAQGAERHTLVELAAFADNGGFTDNNTGAVVDEEAGADGRSGMNVDAGAAVGVFGHDARHERDLKVPKDVGHAMGGDGNSGRIAEDNLIGVGGGRVALVTRQDIRRQQRPQSRQAQQKFIRRLHGLMFDGVGRAAGVQAHALADLAGQGGVEFLQFVNDVVFDIVAGKVLRPEKAGEQNAEEPIDQSINGRTARQICLADVLDAGQGEVAVFQFGDKANGVIIGKTG